MNKKALVLLSGGLDSILAARLMIEQGIEVHAVNYYIEFATCVGGENSRSAAADAAKMLGISLSVVDITAEYLEMFKKPKHGYGANINPCIDCKIFMLRKAKELMKEVGASFLVTGEVLGERPMSQRKDALNIIERDAEVKGILLRPLSALHMEPTLPEKEGVVDRDKLLAIKGRGRKDQLALAKKFGIDKFPNPAGGCLLTDPGFTKRVKDLIEHNILDLGNLRLIKYGRHFRLSKDTKLVIGRDEKENDALQECVKPGDVTFRMKDEPGPFSILRGDPKDDNINLAAKIVSYHTKCRNSEFLNVYYWKDRVSGPTMISVNPAKLEDFDRLRI